MVRTHQTLLITSRSVNPYVLNYFVPVLMGNMVGGVVFVALLNHLQIAVDRADDVGAQPTVIVDHLPAAERRKKTLHQIRQP